MIVLNSSLKHSYSIYTDVQGDRVNEADHADSLSPSLADRYTRKGKMSISSDDQQYC